MDNLLKLPLALLAALSALGILMISALAALGRLRQRRWESETREMTRSGNTATRMQHIQRALAAAGLFGDLTRRSYTVLTVLSASALLLLPRVSMEGTTRVALWLGLTAASWVGALMLSLHWAGGDDDREALLQRKLATAEEASHRREGLIVRDGVTRLYTEDYWLMALGQRSEWAVRRPTPVTCLMIELESLAKFRDQYGDEAGDRVLAQVGEQITRNVRSTDLVCRHRGPGFAIALLGCPAEHARSVGARVEANVCSLALNAINRRFGSSLHLRRGIATQGGEAWSPLQLLRDAERDLYRSRVARADDRAIHPAAWPLPWRAEMAVAHLGGGVGDGTR